MDASSVLIDGIGRSREVFHDVLDGLNDATLRRRPAEEANPIGWLAWHTARQQDAQIAALAGGPQVWTAGGWVQRFALDLPPESMGYRHTTQDVDKVVASTDLLLGYLDAATDATVAYLRTLSEADLDEVIDRDWDPHVTRGVRLVSIVDDAAQHAGQAAYLRGLFAV